MLKRLWQERVQVALVENRRYALYCFQFHAPLARGTLPRVERKAFRQQRLADVVEPSVVTLRSGAFYFFGFILPAGLGIQGAVSRTQHHGRHGCKQRNSSW